MTGGNFGFLLIVENTCTPLACSPAATDSPSPCADFFGYKYLLIVIYT